jgi:hypothetical protein
MPDIQRIDEYHIGNVQKLLTPKGIQTTGNFATMLPMFLGSYRGGRNESFSYGFNLNQIWNDLDLTAAYTTALALAGNPCFDAGYTIPKNYSSDDLMEFLNSEDIFNSYSAFNVDFEFPKEVLYPNLPVHLNKTLTVYPRSGTTFANGLSLRVAIDNGCRIFNINGGSVIPFGDTPWVSYDELLHVCGVREEVDKGYSKNYKPVSELFDRLPYHSVIKELQSNRRKHPKGSFYNLFYKLLGNSIYGQTAMGLAAKSVFNSRANRMDTVGPSQLTNPVLTSWTTDFVRAVLSELLNYIQQQGGDVISCTTDGFITNLPDMELSKPVGPLTAYFSLSRMLLADDPTYLELKHRTQGVASWATRGQIGLEEGSTLKAMTGYQSKFHTMDVLQDMIITRLDQGNREITFMQQSLRSGKDVYEKGGAVSPKLEERTFRLFYDNRRQVIAPVFNESSNLNMATTITAPTSVVVATGPTIDHSNAIAMKDFSNTGSNRLSPNRVSLRISSNGNLLSSRP